MKIEKSYCINLKHREDRWLESKKEFEKLNLNVERFDAIYSNNGHLGCLKSQLAIIKQAKEENLNNVLIFEDDIRFFDDNTQDYLDKALKDIDDNDWYLLYLGGNCRKKITKHSDYLYKVVGLQCCQSVIYNKKSFDIILNRYKNLGDYIDISMVIDQYLAHDFQYKHDCFMVNPMLTIQRSSLSDIERRVSDNSEIILKNYYNFIKDTPDYKYDD